MEENVQGCSGHCERCSVNQRTYCAAQRSYFLEQEIMEIKTMLQNRSNGEIETIFVRNVETSEVEVNVADAVDETDDIEEA